MTREEEAIRRLSVYSSTNGSGLCTDEQHNEAKQIAIEAIEQTRWIPVSESLPEEDEWVLITFDDDIEIASLDDDGWCYSSVGNDDWIAEHPPVAWMPLPQPYKAESEDEE